MFESELRALAERLLSGSLPIDEFIKNITTAKTAELGAVSLDLDRQRRCGFPEVIFGEGKSLVALTTAVSRLLEENMPVLITRLPVENATRLKEKFSQAKYNQTAGTFRIGTVTDETTQAKSGEVTVVTAGTSDLPIAEEARETLEWMGIEVTMVYDVGVAGPHRLPAQLDKLRDADAIIVVAGMEGALPSVVGGYVDAPVIAVPTSVGYGSSFGGVTALLGMLNSCASNVTVVNIDGGFKAAYVAGLVASRAKRGR